WDTNLNKVTSEYFWFLAASQAPTPAFGIIAGLFGLAASVFIIKRIKK
ncbi:MAG: PGF-CTERM sorting domain-containing protein, partial [Candidatus Heimdallarchaeota archaeon]